MDENMQLHSDLAATLQLIYAPCQFICTSPIEEAQNAEYGAYHFTLNELSIRFRSAKTTPTKIGQFVTLWERKGGGQIQPYDETDAADLFVISTRSGDRFGQFVFPKAVLCVQDIVSRDFQGGKRGIRVYPPWDITTSRQAQKTQNWQLAHFLEIPWNQPPDINRVRMLYSL